MRYFFFLFIVVGAFVSHGQPKSIVFRKMVHDWGTMISTQFPPAAFVYVNNSSRPVAILTTRSPFSVKVSYQREYVNPGDSGIVYVTYESNQTGMFKEPVEVLFNIDQKPIKLWVKGNNVSVISCVPDPKNYRNREVRVIDAITKEPVKNAQCSFLSYNKNNPTEFTCNDKGVKQVDLPIAMYEISIQAPGYYPYNVTSMVPKSAPILYYELERSPFYSDSSRRSTKVVSKPKSESKPFDNERVGKQPTKQILASADSLLPREKFKPNNIVFLLDISNSMNASNKFKQLKICVKHLISALRSNDTVSIITYNFMSSVQVEASAGDKHQRLLTIIDNIHASGLTEGVKGLENAFSIAQKHYIAGGNNQLILATDGEFVGGHMTDSRMKELVTDNYHKGIILSTVGFGDVPEAIERLRNLANTGGGSYVQTDNQIDNVSKILDEVKNKSLIKEY